MANLWPVTDLSIIQRNRDPNKQRREVIKEQGEKVERWKGEGRNGLIVIRERGEGEGGGVDYQTNPDTLGGVGKCTAETGKGRWTQSMGKVVTNLIGSGEMWDKPINIEKS